MSHDTPPEKIDWRSIFLRYRDLIVAEEGIDYLSRALLFTDEEAAAVYAAIDEDEAAAKVKDDAETIQRLTSDASAVYIIDRGDLGLFLVKDGKETPVEAYQPSGTDRDSEQQ